MAAENTPASSTRRRRASSPGRVDPDKTAAAAAAPTPTKNAKPASQATTLAEEDYSISSSSILGTIFIFVMLGFVFYFQPWSTISGMSLALPKCETCENPLVLQAEGKAAADYGSQTFILEDAPQAEKFVQSPTEYLSFWDAPFQWAQIQLMAITEEQEARRCWCPTIA